MSELFYVTEDAARIRAANVPGASVFSKSLPDGRLIWGVRFPEMPTESGDLFARMRARQNLEP